MHGKRKGRAAHTPEVELTTSHHFSESITILRDVVAVTGSVQSVEVVKFPLTNGKLRVPIIIIIGTQVDRSRRDPVCTQMPFQADA